MFYILPFFRQLYNSFFPKLFIILSKELFQVSNFRVLWELKFIPLREFYKDQSKCISEGAMSGEYGGWIRTSSQGVTVFAWLSNQRSCSVVMEYYVFSVDYSWTLSSHTAFSWSNWKQYLLDLIGFLEGTHNKGLPSNPTIHHHLWMKTVLWCGCWWFISLVPWSFAVHIIVPTFHHPSRFVFFFLNGEFLLRFTRESHVETQSKENRMWKHSQEGLFHFTYMEPNHQSE